jgi:hypothetical protein
MSDLRFACCDDVRRNAVVGHAALNAIDFVVVGDLSPAELDPQQLAEYNALPAGPQRDRLLWQRRLSLHFVNPLLPQQLAGLAPGSMRILGGERIKGIRVESVATAADSAVVKVSQAGDFSRYRLELVRSAVDTRPPAGFDPILSGIDFSFKIDCPSEFDCRGGHVCLRTTPDEPEIDYLAKDYASFRRLILDRLALLMPDWRDRSPADLGMALVELLAYVGDHLSYEQDAVATEAYLETARLRTSVRRHALLVDYAMHDGCNARAWLHVEVGADTSVLPADLRFVTSVADVPARIVPASRDEETALAADAEWFEPVVAELDPDIPPVPITFVADHNHLTFYTWGDDRCCLPRGATTATLLGHHPALAPGTVLVLEEVVGPLTGQAADADRRHRHAVRLTEVIHGDENGPLVDPLDDTPITPIAWAAADALPFALCISARTEGGASLADVSVARGNVILVDHGRTIDGERLGLVPPARLALPGDPDQEHCDHRVTTVPVRFRPRLAEGPVTATQTVRKETRTTAGRVSRRVRFDPDAAAAAAFAGDARGARPAIRLESVHETDVTPWLPVGNLLDSAPDAAEFVVESEHDGSARLRFGADGHGRSPRTDEAFTATYRVGNGRAGNVGADAITHVVTVDARIEAVRNPLPAAGGADPETTEQVRRRAPEAFRTQERAVTPADYESVMLRLPDVQRAAATLRWTGSWHTVFLTVDRAGGEVLDDAIEAGMAGHVDRFRMAGHDLEFDDPRFVPLEVHLEVCVRPEYFRADVKARLLDTLSNRALPDGRRGLFHPDAFSFGQTIHLSPILAAAHDVPGVASASVTAFHRQGTPETRSLADGRLALGRLEIARLDNDPDFPEHGVLRFAMSGGK